ncbi:MAG: ABC transporter ATP-binding protein [Candidatus Kariarchaeaceae archaeon]|jgi:ABC-2 type transport system ATP-binding protein
MTTTNTLVKTKPTSKTNGSQKSSGRPIISLRNVTKIYPGNTVGIEDLSLEIMQGEIFGFLGQNGAGKTTAIRSILNILLPQQGEIEVDGVPVTRDHPEIRENIGYLPGEINIPGNSSVKEFLHYVASLKKRSSDRMMEIAERFELPLEKKVGELSKGNKQKVGIVLAFMHSPEIYILDEPTSGLDPLWQQELYDLILEEKAKGHTVFFSSHNLDETQRLCDRVGIIREGRLVTVETVVNLSEKIPRKLSATISDLSEDDIALLSGQMQIATFNLETGMLVVSISGPGELAMVIEHLNSLNSRLKDLSYPPASLEEYFLSKYR